ncbi:MAG: 4Fe-4S binding protein [Alphaproteobacteria bacterium]|nr:4Fe-4S binding protein [Alphaproteobacteria bacterium]MBQ9235245.1 4Fe-4S binding protein [Alphaproteobacteria bacterium]
MPAKYFFLLRRALAIVLGVLLLVGFAGWFYPLPLFDLQLVPLLQSLSLSFTTLACLLVGVVVVLTLLFGRIYCSTLCPLGLLQELLLFLYHPLFHRFKKKSSGNFYQKHYAWHYVLAALLLGAMLGGTALLVRMFDPYSIFGNAASKARFGLAVVMILAVVVFFRKRFFCVNICPVGAVLGWLSRFALFKIHFAADGCVKCGMCARHCPSGSIDYVNQSINNETCVRCLRCLVPCRKGSIIGASVQPKPEIPFSPARRRLLISAAVLGAFAGAFKAGASISQMVAQKVKRVIVPAGAKNYRDFANRCLNCNLCVGNCPMKIIKKADSEYPAVHIDYGENFCKYDCCKCSQVCPSGAIRKIPLSEKQNTQIAVAVVDEDRCIGCGLCVRECPRSVISKDEEKAMVDASECIGCGVCASVCPVKAINIYPVEEQRFM